MKLRDKTAVITGGNSGIGRAITHAFTNEGADVVIFGRNRTTLDETTRTVGNGTLAVRGDATDLADLDTLVREAIAKLGGIDVLVVSAGIARFAPVAEADEAFFDQIIDINLKGAYFTVQKFLPHLNEGGSIMMVTSALDTQGVPGASVYSASKAALRSLARTLAAELAERNIRVNVISPGPIDTPIYDRMGVPAEEMDGFKSSLTAQIPLQRFGRADEVARAALFLAADATFTNASELVVDGGFSQV